MNHDSPTQDFNLDANDLMAVPCDICGNNHFEPIKTGDRFGIPVTAGMCTQCGLVMINPRPNEAWFQNFYRHHYRNLYESVTVPDESYISNRRRLNKHRTNIQFISEHLDLNGLKVMDIGSAEGLMLDLLRREFHCEVTGVEANIRFAEFSRQHFALPDIRVGDFFAVVGAEERFDFIHCSHVFEHILKPNQFLQRCHQLLRDDGMLFLDVPDVYTERSGIHYFHIAHAYYYSVDTLSHLLANNGFVVKAITNQLKFHAPRKPPWTIHVIAQKNDGSVPPNRLTYSAENVKKIKNQWI